MGIESLPGERGDDHDEHGDCLDGNVYALGRK